MVPPPRQRAPGPAGMQRPVGVNEATVILHILFILYHNQAKALIITVLKMRQRKEILRDLYLLSIAT